VEGDFAANQWRPHGDSNPGWSRSVLGTQLLSGRCVRLLTVDDTTVTRYCTWVINSFADKVTAAVFAGEQVRKLPPEIQQAARRKLADRRRNEP
jgi:hypothetical protein